jgi:tripartite ATP-independent transporter DctP family solute receptor
MRVVKLFVIAFVVVYGVGSVFASGTNEKSGTAGQPQKSIILRYAHVGMPGEDQTRYATEFAARVNQATNGRVQVQVFPNSQLGGQNEILNGVKSGSIAMTQGDYALLGTYVPDFAVMDAPYVFTSGAQALQATGPSSPIVETLNKELVAKAGIRLIGNFYRGARELTANVPIYKPSDLVGKRIRAVPIPLWTSMIKGMGATPVPVNVSELETALMTGVVIGQENPINMIQSAKLYEAQKYVMMTDHMYSVLAVFINEATWEKIPKNDQQIIEKVAQDMAQVSLQWNKESTAQMKATLESEGMKFIDASNGLDVAAFRAAVQKQIETDFPSWGPVMKELEAVK